MNALRRCWPAGVLVLAACTGPGPGDAACRAPDEFLACGLRFHAATPVVLWTDPGGYDGYRVEPRFPELMGPDALAAWVPKARYHSLRLHLDDATRRRVQRDGMDLDTLRRHVDQVVVHYDASGTSRSCFRTLQDRRGLSCHFLLDVDGTVYQTLDLKERAWHAAQANDRSVGIEIAHVGAYDRPDHGEIASWYAVDERGPYVTFAGVDATGVRTPGYEARPARPELLSGAIHGQVLYQYDFTSEQYRALARLLAALHRVLPGIVLDAPRDAGGRVLGRALSAEELARFSGVLGHYHVTERKVDPGPAFDWERVLAEARALAGAATS